MAIGRDSTIVRLLARLLARGGSEVRMRQRMRELRGVLRFNILMGLAVLLPAVLMGWFALATIRSEEILVEADLARTAGTIVVQAQDALHGEFTGFERRTLDRLHAGQSPDANLAELSPTLLAAFRFDENGQLAAPFGLLPDTPTIEPTRTFRTAWKRAVQLERSGDCTGALPAYVRAADAAGSAALSAEAALGRARCLGILGDRRHARRILDELYADYPDLRDRYGFRIGDLVTLRRADLAKEDDRVAGRALYEGLVEDILASRWTIYRPNEAAIARRALASVAGLSDPDWVGRQRTRLTERTRQLYWAEYLVDDLQSFVDLHRSGEGVFEYSPGRRAGALWATVTVDDALYAFAFDGGAILKEVRSVVRRAAPEDGDVTAWLAGPEAPRPVTPLASRDLGPWFRSVSVIVTPASPEIIVEKKNKRRLTRIIILVLAVGTSILGLFLSIRLVRGELSNARMKTDFAANVSHELRSPITQIRLKAEALVLDLMFNDKEKAHAYDVILRESERLSRLVDNILDFAAIEAGAKKYMFRHEDFGEILLKSVRAATPQLQEAGIDVEVQVPDDLPMARVDAEAIGQVLTNLLSNAVKYGSDGKWVGVSATANARSIEVIVEDRGMGISPEDLAHLFDNFFRSSAPEVRRRKGTGIGLAIVRYIVEAHDGEIHAASERGKGTRFTFTLPLTPTSEA